MVKYNESQLTDVFHALADPTRRKILRMVAARQRRASELADAFEISFPAVSKHVKVLENAKLIQRSVDGRIHRFSFDEKALRKAFEWLAFYEKFWSERLDGLAAMLENQD